MTSRNYRYLPNIKSRLAGFFAFILLSACQPAGESEAGLIKLAQTDAVAASQLASMRLANTEYDAALYWFRQAALLGDSQALAHALQLQQRQQGRLATAQWLQQQLAAGDISASTVSLTQRAELGLWPDKPFKQEPGYQHAQGCKLTLQPVASQQGGVTRWLELQQQWQNDKQLAQLPVCFLPLATVNSTVLACTEQSDTLLQCQYQMLDSLVAQGTFSQLVVIAGRGKASYNNGILQLPDNASLALLRHEFMHVLGFIDEYELSYAAAQQLCQPGHIYPNVIIGEDSRRYKQRWALAGDAISLTAVDTCQQTAQQAYRISHDNNLMRSYELALPPIYVALAQQILQQPERLMPVQYYFAYLARQQQNWSQWQRHMQLAADWGYIDASKALALGGDSASAR
ncbi:hypothetical protein [Rheinheimera maricola]|uniref:Uncharacterized protein n=1 Tax=Rheinheimera maricola TaxID=2793282 RepID=A0ABS7XBK7_9GAMM|nr:hypothetical protein [Rheinheimera maricola]MBZ9612939.1 hypothetical protein [Rheinheimera maricola]